MISNRSIKNSVLAAAFATAAWIGGSSQGSASVVDTFTLTPATLNAGGTSTIDLLLNLNSDFACNTATCQGYYGAYFSGGTVTIFDGIGGSQSFNIGSGGTSRDFQLQSTYLNGGNYQPTFTQTAMYMQYYDVNQTIYSSNFTAYLSGQTDLTVAQTPLPAALPLFATGLGVMGLLGWRRKRKSAAAIAA
jgi:hypothetical protein